MTEMQSYEFMEVNEEDLRNQGLPNVDVLKSSYGKQFCNDQLSPMTFGMPSQPPREQISLFKKQCPQPIQLLQQPAEDIKPNRQQQTHEPVCPPQDFLPLSTDLILRVENKIGAVGDDSSEGLAPSLEGFDDLPDQEWPQLSAEDVEQTLMTAQSMLPEGESGDPTPCVPLIQDEQKLIILDYRQRQPSIRLMSCSSNGENEKINEIIHELMDDEQCVAGAAAQCEHDMSPARSPTSSEHRLYHETAKYVLELHQDIARDMQQAKKKPMLHEFLGYILYLGAKKLQLGLLRNAVYFCDDCGERQSEPGEHFRVANFQAVSEVWKLIKCNSSKDCTKNMKRAMRMSTSNDRHYFVNLPQRMHRMQVFKFGQRSIEYFRKMFPSSY